MSQISMINLRTVCVILVLSAVRLYCDVGAKKPWRPQYNLPWGPDYPRLNMTGIDKHIDKVIHANWDGFKLPPSIDHQWRIYHYEMDKKMKSTYFTDKTKGMPGPGWQGTAPPPWAYSPKYYGLDTRCLHPPRYGHCNKTETRWAYNKFLKTCQTFYWSGCGGSMNRFVSYAACAKLCYNTTITKTVCGFGIDEAKQPPIKTKKIYVYDED